MWIDASKTELDAIENVIWHLHPTFSPTEVEIDDRFSKFALETSGWGNFLVRVTIALKDGSKERLSQELELSYPDGSLAED